VCCRQNHYQLAAPAFSLSQGCPLAVKHEEVLKANTVYRQRGMQSIACDADGLSKGGIFKSAM